MISLENKQCDERINFNHKQKSNSTVEGKAVEVMAAYREVNQKNIVEW